MRPSLRIAATALILSLLGASAGADMVYNVSGTFGADLPGDSMPTGLAGGSFTLTFEADGLPLAIPGGYTSLGSFSLSTYDSLGNLSYSFGDPTGSDGFIIDYDNPPDITLAYFYDPLTVASLNLDFSPGFDGTGAILPTDFATYSDNASLYFDPNGNAVTIVSGSSSPSSVPEPTSLTLLIAGSFMMRRWFRSRHEAVA